MTLKKSVRLTVRFWAKRSKKEQISAILTTEVKL